MRNVDRLWFVALNHYTKMVHRLAPKGERHRWTGSRPSTRCGRPVGVMTFIEPKFLDATVVTECATCYKDADDG